MYIGGLHIDLVFLYNQLKGTKFCSIVLWIHWQCSSSFRMQSSYSVSTRICWIWDKVIFPVVYMFLSPGVPKSKLNLWELLHFLVLLTVDTFVGDIELTRRNETDRNRNNSLWMTWLSTWTYLYHTLKVLTYLFERFAC